MIQVLVLQCALDCNSNLTCSGLTLLQKELNSPLNWNFILLTQFCFMHLFWWILAADVMQLSGAICSTLSYGCKTIKTLKCFL